MMALRQHHVADNIEDENAKGVMHVRKLPVLILILALALSVFAGCSNNGNGNKTNEPQNNAGNTNAPATGNDTATGEQGTDKPSYWAEDGAEVELFMASHASWPYKEEWPVWDYIKEGSNITVKAQIPSGEYADALSLTMASGDLPDLFQIWAGDDSKYGQDGAFVNLVEHLDKMPNLAKFWEEHPEVKNNVTLPDGSVYLAVSEGASFSNQRAWQYRKEVFDEHGLEAPKTFQELYDVSKKLKEVYPDSYPLVWRGGIGALGNMAPAFGINRDYHPDLETREVEYGAISDEMKELITWMNKFAADGLIPPDWLSVNANQWTSYVTNGQSFITVDYIGRIEYMNSNFEGGGEHMVYMAPPAGIEGKPGYVLDAYFNREGFAVASTSKNQEAAFKYIDFVFSEEGQELLSWGKEGETYETVDGKKKVKYASFDELRKETGIGSYGSYGYFKPEAAYSMMDDATKAVYEAVGATAYPEKIITPTFTEEETEIMSVEDQAVKKARDESLSKFIIGERPLSEWDAYVQEVKDLGVEKVIEIHEAAWKRSGVIE